MWSDEIEDLTARWHIAWQPDPNDKNKQQWQPIIWNLYELAHKNPVASVESSLALIRSSPVRSAVRQIGLVPLKYLLLNYFDFALDRFRQVLPQDLRLRWALKFALLIEHPSLQTKLDVLMSEYPVRPIDLKMAVGTNWDAKVLQQLINAWTLFPESPQGEPNSWASERIYELINEDPDRCWTFILSLLKEDASLSMSTRFNILMTALLKSDYDDFIELIEVETKVNPLLVTALESAFLDELDRYKASELKVLLRKAGSKI